MCFLIQSSWQLELTITHSWWSEPWDRLLLLPRVPASPFLLLDQWWSHSPSHRRWGSHNLGKDIGLHAKKRDVLSKRTAGPPRAETTCKREGGKPIRRGHGSTRETWLQNQMEHALWIYHVSYCASKLKYSVLQLNGDKIAFSGFWRKHHKVRGMRVRRL